MQIGERKTRHSLWYVNRVLFALLCLAALYFGPLCEYLQQSRNAAVISEHRLRKGAVYLKTLYLPRCNSRGMPFQICSLDSLEHLQIRQDAPTRLLFLGAFFLCNPGEISIEAITGGQVEVWLDGQSIGENFRQVTAKLPPGRHILRVTYASEFARQNFVLSVQAKNQQMKWQIGNEVYSELTHSCRKQFSLQSPSKVALLLHMLMTLALLSVFYPGISRLGPRFDTVILTAALIRTIFVMKFHHPADFIYSDMQGYWTRAWEFYAGALGGPYQSFYPPGTHWFFGAWLKCFGKKLYFLEIAMVLLSTGIVSLVMRIALEFLEKKQALTAGVLCALHYPFISFSGLLMSEIPFVFLQTLAVYFLVLALREKPGRFLLFSSVAALSAYFRSTSLLLIVQGPLLLLISRGRRGLAKTVLRSLAGLILAAVIVFPCALRNNRLTGEFHLISSNGGINFLQGNLDIRKVNFNGPKGQWSFCSPLHAISRGDSPDFNTSLAPWESKKLLEIAWAHVRKNPGQSLMKCFDKGLDIFSRYPPWPSSSTKFVYINYVYHTLYLAILIPLALVGAGVMFRQKRRFSPLVLLTPIVNVIAIAFVFYGTSRFRLPADPFFLILGTVGIDAMRKSDRHLQKKLGDYFHKWAKRPKTPGPKIRSLRRVEMKRNLKIFALFLALFFSACNSTVQKKQNDGNYDKGVKAFESGNMEKAVGYFEKSVAAAPKNGLTFYKLGETYEKLQQPEKARSAYEQAAKLLATGNISSLEISQALGKANRYIGKYQKSIYYYKESLKQDPEDYQANWGVGYCKFQQELYADAIPFLQKCNRANPGDPEVMFLLAKSMQAKERGVNKTILGLYEKSADKAWLESILNLAKIYRSNDYTSRALEQYKNYRKQGGTLDKDSANWLEEQLRPALDAATQPVGTEPVAKKEVLMACPKCGRLGAKGKTRCMFDGTALTPLE